MASSSPQESGVPQQFANVPPDLSGTVGQSRVIAGAVETAIRDALKDQRHSDFVYIISIFAGGFLLLAGMLIVGYFKLDEKINAASERLTTKVDGLTVTSAKVDTKLEDLLQRIPPVPTPAPRK